jgi:hypothetical protein
MWGDGGRLPISTAVHRRSPNKLWRSTSIFSIYPMEGTEGSKSYDRAAFYSSSAVHYPICFTYISDRRCQELVVCLLLRSVKTPSGVYPDPAPHLRDLNLRPLVYKPSSFLKEFPRLNSELLKLLTFDFMRLRIRLYSLNADPNPASQSNVDPDPHSATLPISYVSCVRP